MAFTSDTSHQCGYFYTVLMGPQEADLPPGQLARRARVLQAAIDLAAQGGYDVVQMREVAQRAGVAMGTIYRYFDSKDQLLAAALVDWSDRMADALEARPPRGSTPAERLIDVIRRATRNIERNPQLTAALITGVTSAEGGVRRYQEAVAGSLARILSSGLDGVSPDDREAILRILRHVWFAALLGWVNGWRGVSSVGEELEFAARRLLGQPAEVLPAEVLPAEVQPAEIQPVQVQPAQAQPSTASAVVRRSSTL